MSAVPDRSSVAQAGQMDAIYAVQRHIYDLTRKYYLLGCDRLIRDLRVPDRGFALEVGCGTARNLVLAGQRYPLARLHGIDISEEMLKSARAKFDATPAAERACFAQADATGFDPVALFGVRRFDRVFASYTLSMIPDWRGAIRMAASILAHGGELHIVDFGQQSQLPGWFRSLLRAWLAKFHVTPRADLFAFSQTLAEELGLTCECRTLYRDYARSVVLARP